MTSTTLAFDSPVDAARPRSVGPGSDFSAYEACHDRRGTTGALP